MLCLSSWWRKLCSPFPCFFISIFPLYYTWSFGLFDFVHYFISDRIVLRKIQMKRHTEDFALFLAGLIHSDILGFNLDSSRVLGK